MQSFLCFLVVIALFVWNGQAKDVLLERRKEESRASRENITEESIEFINLCNSDVNLPRLRELLAMPEVDLNAMEPRRHRTALMMAVTFFDIADNVLRLLLAQSGIEFNKENYLGKTALHYAAENNNLLALNWLVRFKGIRVNHQAFGRDGATPLMLAARVNAKAAVKILLSHKDIDLTVKTYTTEMDVYGFAAENEHSKPTLDLIRAHEKKMKWAANKETVGPSSDL